MKATLNLTPFVPDDFPKQTLRSVAGININKAGKFSINKNGKELTGFGSGDKVVMFQNEEPLTSIWFIRRDKSGWPLRDNAQAGLHFSAKYLARAIFECFGLDPEAGSFTFFMHDESIDMNGEQYWILFNDEDSLQEFLQSLQEEKKQVNGHKPERKGGTVKGKVYLRQKRKESIYDGRIDS